jgi:mercuric ion transport protein
MRNPSSSRSLKGWVLLVTGFLTCPCHLPLFAAIFAGTALGGFLSEYFAFILPVTVLYFIVALIVGLKLLAPARAKPSADATSTAMGAAPSPAVPKASGRSQKIGLKR